MQHPEICIAGAGLIGLSLALELAHRGADVLVLDRAKPLAEASTAAAGMLAALDPDNPPALRPLSALSLALYPSFLARVAALSGTPVPFQTHATLQHSLTHAPTSTISSADLHHLLPNTTLDPAHLSLLHEHSLDPRQLAAALHLAVAHTPNIRLLPETPIVETIAQADSVEIRTSAPTFHARHFVDCTGAWSLSAPGAAVPRKGQMLSVTIPPSLALSITLRTEHLYIVPRTLGPQAGRAIIGATVEDAGFNKATDADAINHLHTAAAALLPQLAGAERVEQWAGLRPATRDLLPLLGPHPHKPRHLLATGHFRNGILLAPATAQLVAQLLAGEPTSLDLTPFAPARLLELPPNQDAAHPIR